MKFGTVVLVGGGIFLAWKAYQLAVGTGTLEVIFKDVRVNGPLNYTIILTAQNISDADITANSMTGNILLNGEQFASISNFTKTVIPANGQVDIPITVQPSLLDLPGNIQSLIQNGGQTLDFTVTGNVNASGFVLPFTLDKTFNI